MSSDDSTMAASCRPRSRSRESCANKTSRCDWLPQPRAAPPLTFPRRFQRDQVVTVAVDLFTTRRRELRQRVLVAGTDQEGERREDDVGAVTGRVLPVEHATRVVEHAGV